jgi:hypothetical protein
MSKKVKVINPIYNFDMYYNSSKVARGLGVIKYNASYSRVNVTKYNNYFILGMKICLNKTKLIK